MKRKGIYVLGIVIFCLITTSVFAANRTDMLKGKLNSSVQELEAGEEVTITLKFEQYNKITKGVHSFKAGLEYDEKVFENVGITNFKMQNNWEELKYNPETKELVAIKKAGSKQEEDILQITLKVKQEVEAGKSNITMKDIVASEGREDLLMGDASVQLDIIKEQEPKPEEPGKITSEKYRIVEGYIYRILPETSVKEFKENVTTNEKLVFTDKDGVTLKAEDDIATGTKVKVGTSSEYTLIVIGDVDQDTQITINDLAKTKLHLIDYKLLTGAGLKAADVDDDEEVTINDIARLKMILIDLLKLK